jgi:DNA-binding beta-propeller fold protein YncE
MLTGLPTVLGWEHHVKQRGNPEPDIAERREAIERIYSSREAAPIERLLRRYHVGYVYVGWLERKTYPVDGLRKFDRATDLFECVYENPEVRIYRVIGGDSEDVIVPARETVPVAAGGEVVEEEETPSIAETPEEGRAPFSGMKEPRDGDFDKKERLWIADFGNSRIRIFDRDGGFLGGWGGRGNSTYALREPCSVSIRDEDVYVADTWNGRVQHFSLSGESKGVAGELYGPRGVATAPDGKVWITDTGNHRLVVYDAQLENRQFIGKRGAGPLEFSSPVGIAISTSGTVYVADAANHRIQILAHDASYLRALPVNGWNGAVEPHLEVGTDDSIYFTDPSANAVVALDSTGTEKGRWAEDDEGRKFANPTGLALDRKRNILYVVNSGSSTISRLTIRPQKAS